MKFSSCAVTSLAVVVGTAPHLASSFAPAATNQRRHVVTSKRGDVSLNMNLGAAFVSAGIGSLALLSPPADAPPAPVSGLTTSGPSIVVSAAADITDIQAPSALKDVEKKALKEVKAIEKEIKTDEKKAKVERGREAFFEYEAQMAAEDEARIEAAERKFAMEATKDKEEAAKLLAEEKRLEDEAARASSKAEAAKKKAEAKKLLAEEKKLERKEKRAEQLERTFLAEETQEKQILEAKAKAARAEKAKFEAVEKELEQALTKEVSQIEAAEKIFDQELKLDKDEVAKLKAAEQQAEKEAALATTKAKKAKKQAEARRLLAAEKAAERKEKQAEKLEYKLLSEEQKDEAELKTVKETEAKLENLLFSNKR